MNHQTKRTILVPMNVNVLSRQLKLVSMQRHALHSDSRLVIVSKRRVPNGPDPIHNRRARKYRQPPNQA
ncbi:Clavata3/ESR (CLE) gene family member MtCLE02 [Medicago truncatula]|nr:Clavata3/ESR (CLE) gene family member MtCLE02 [Medicago truncatula]